MPKVTGVLQISLRDTSPFECFYGLRRRCCYEGLIRGKTGELQNE